MNYGNVRMDWAASFPINKKQFQVRAVIDCPNCKSRSLDHAPGLYKFKPSGVYFQMNSTKRLLIAMPLIISILWMLLGGCATQKAHPKPLNDKQLSVLNGLRDEINFTYGYVDGWPRIDRGPCGRFANLFYQAWNKRFRDKVCIAFVMITNGYCDHVLIKLPDGSYYDGGNGVISGATLLREFRSGDRIEDMKEFDFSLLDKRSYGLKRSYELCTNYSDEVTGNIIEKHLAQLPGR